MYLCEECYKNGFSKQLETEFYVADLVQVLLPFLSFKYENFLGEREEKKIAKEDEKNYS